MLTASTDWGIIASSRQGAGSKLLESKGEVKVAEGNDDSQDVTAYKEVNVIRTLRSLQSGELDEKLRDKSFAKLSYLVKCPDTQGTELRD